MSGILGMYRLKGACKNITHEIMYILVAVTSSKQYLYACSHFMRFDFSRKSKIAVSKFNRCDLEWY